MGSIQPLLCTPVRLTPGFTLPLARYHFTFHMHSDLRLPEFAGSLLRGQFGAALRRTACMTGSKTCGGCPLLRTCPYPAIFETPAPATHHLQKFSQVPNPYVIEPPRLGIRRVVAGESLSFSIVLVGRALAQLALVTFSLQRAFRHGIGKERAQGELVSIVCESGDDWTQVYDCDADKLVEHDAAVQVPDLAAAETVTLEIETPLRLQDNGRPLGPEALTPRRLVTALMRRASLLFELHADIVGLAHDATAIAAAAERLTDERALRWHDWRRYSSRQQAEMTLGGVLGTWTLHGELSSILPWLWLGQGLHVGKNATMGLGRYRLTRTPGVASC